MHAAVLQLSLTTRASKEGRAAIEQRIHLQLTFPDQSGSVNAEFINSST